MAKVVSVLTLKGGAGKSTVAVNLACGLQRHLGKRVLIIDTDSKVQTATMWRYQSAEDYDAPRVIQVTTPTLEGTLPAISEGIDYIVIDGRAHDEKMAISSLKASDLVIVPVQPSAADYWGGSEIINLIEARHEVTDGHPRAAFLITNQTARTNLAATIEGVLARHDGIGILDARTTHLVAYPEAIGAGESTIDYDPGGKAAAETIALTEEVHSIVNG